MLCTPGNCLRKLDLRGTCLCGTTLDAATEVVERLRTAVAEVDETLPSGLVMTVSLGMTACRAGDAASEMLKRADLALYRAKDSGRNRYVAG